MKRLIYIGIIIVLYKAVDYYIVCTKPDAIEAPKDYEEFRPRWLGGRR